jgi:tetratricopeptide (TPR) repeat protein
MFVGRERDLRTLDASWDACIEDHTAQAVVVLGEAGVGKTRLRDEWMRTLATRCACEMTMLLGRAEASKAGVPYALVGSAIARACAIDDYAVPALRQKLLIARLASTLDSGDVERVAWFLGETIAAGFEAHDARLSAARGNPRLMTDQIARAWHDWLRAECSKRPVALVFEDIHWGDRASLDLVDDALRTLHDQAWMAVAFGRNEVRQRFPDLWTERSALELSLGALTKRAAERFVRAVLPQCTQVEIDTIVERAAGNAFVLEELARARAEGRGDAIPPGVAAVAQARFDAMDPSDRRVLRAASVFGGAFRSADVEALTGGTPDIAARLDVLVRREALTRDGDRFVFRHDLLRDAAYAALTHANRVLGHYLAGTHLEASGAVDAHTLAEHFERGERSDKAIAQWTRAAAQRVGAYDLDGAIECVRRGVAAGASAEALGALRAIEAEALRWSGEPAEAAKRATEALALLPRGAATWYRAIIECVVATWATNEERDFTALAEEVLACSDVANTFHVRARALSALARLMRAHSSTRARCFAWIESFDDGRLASDPMLAAECYHTRSHHAHAAGDLAAYLVHKRNLDRAYIALGDRRNACVNRDNIGYALTRLGRWHEAESVLRAALAEAEAMRLPEVAAGLRDNLAPVLARRGYVAEALAMEREAIAFFVSRAHIPYELDARATLAEICLMTQDLDGATREAHETIARAVACHAQPQPRCYVVLARVHLLRTEFAEALAQARAAYALRGDGVDRNAATLVWAEALWATGDEAGAIEAIRDARDELVTRAARMGDTAARESYLNEVPEHARTLRLAREWRRAEHN